MCIRDDTRIAFPFTTLYNQKHFLQAATNSHKSVFYYNCLTCNIYALLVEQIIITYGLMILIMHTSLTEIIIEFLSIFLVFVSWIIFHNFFCLSADIFFKLTFTFHVNLSKILSECQTVWIQIKSDPCRTLSDSKLFAKIILFVCFGALNPSQQFFSYFMISCIYGLNQY